MKCFMGAALCNHIIWLNFVARPVTVSALAHSLSGRKRYESKILNGRGARGTNQTNESKIWTHSPLSGRRGLAKINA